MLTFSVNRGIKKIKMNLDFIRNAESTGRVGEANDIRRQWLSTLYINMCKGNAEQNTDITAYAVSCNKNRNLAIANSEVPIISSDDLEAGVKGICSDSIGYDESRFKDIEEYSKFLSDLYELLNFADFLEIEEDIDLVQTMLSALDGSKTSIKLLQELISKYDMKDLLYSVMSVPEWGKSLKTVASMA